jgi:hypothetical protein
MSLLAQFRSFERPSQILMVNQFSINLGFYMLMPYLAGPQPAPPPAGDERRPGGGALIRAGRGCVRGAAGRAAGRARRARRPVPRPR